MRAGTKEGETTPHLATTLGVRNDPAFQKAYWRAFERTFGEQNARMVKGLLLARIKRADTGEGEIDRVCLGLRTTMAWLAESIEKSALQEAGLAGLAAPPST